MKEKMLLKAIGSLLIMVCTIEAAMAQAYDPASGKSPLVLLEAPKDGVTYFHLKERAEKLHATEKWAEAEPLLDQLVRAYPRDPHVWMMMARTKRRLNKFVEAAEAAKLASPVIPGGQGSYIVALNYLDGGKRQEALLWLRKALFEDRGIIRQRLLDYFPGFERLKDEPGFAELIGKPDASGWTREEGWARDLDFLYKEVKRVNPEYHDEPFPAEFERRYAALRRDIPKLSDEQIFVKMQQMLAVLGQGHLSLWADQTARTPNRYLPLRFYAFPDGIYIIDASEEHEGLIGSRVLTIGAIPAAEALRQIALANSADGDMEHIWATSRLAEGYFLKGMGAIDSTAIVPLTLASPGQRPRSLRIATLPAEMPAEMPDRADRLTAPPRVEPPLFLQNVEKTFWHQPLAEPNTFYVQINNLSDTSGESLDSYGQRLWEDLQSAKPKNLIVDLRHNNGGTTQNYPNLLRTLIAFSRVPENQLYVLIGRRTYSAAANFVTDLERLADPIFVGEATSQCCNFFGDPIPTTLPYSRVQGEYTAMRWNLSEPADKRSEMAPDVPVQLTAEDYFGGKDPVMEATLELIRPDGQQ